MKNRVNSVLIEQKENLEKLQGKGKNKQQIMII